MQIKSQHKLYQHLNNYLNEIKEELEKYFNGKNQNAEVILKSKYISIKIHISLPMMGNYIGITAQDDIVFYDYYGVYKDGYIHNELESIILKTIRKAKYEKIKNNT